MSEGLTPVEFFEGRKTSLKTSILRVASKILLPTTLEGESSNNIQLAARAHREGHSIVLASALHTDESDPFRFTRDVITPIATPDSVVGFLASGEHLKKAHIQDGQTRMNELLGNVVIIPVVQRHKIKTEQDPHRKKLLEDQALSYLLEMRRFLKRIPEGRAIIALYPHGQRTRTGDFTEPLEEGTQYILKKLQSSLLVPVSAWMERNYEMDSRNYFNRMHFNVGEPVQITNGMDINAFLLNHWTNTLPDERGLPR